MSNLSSQYPHPLSGRVVHDVGSALMTASNGLFVFQLLSISHSRSAVAPA